MKKSIILCLSILMIALTGCKKDQNTWGKLEEGALYLEVGQTKQLHFTSDGNVKPQWVSEDENIATVDQSGNVTAVRVGTVYVSVNGLQCKVTVTDDMMYVVEPSQNWLSDFNAVSSYMTKNFGAVVPTLEYDTVTVIEEIVSYPDSVWNQDSMYYEYFVAFDTTFLAVPYIKTAAFEYEVVLEGQFAHKYVYNFEFNETDYTYLDATQNSLLMGATMTVNDSHVGEIAKYLNNRYVELTKGTSQYKAANKWGYYSYILNASPDIIYSATKIEDK